MLKLTAQSKSDSILYGTGIAGDLQTSGARQIHMNSADALVPSCVAMILDSALTFDHVVGGGHTDFDLANWNVGRVNTSPFKECLLVLDLQFNGVQINGTWNESSILELDERDQVDLRQAESQLTFLTKV